MLGSEWVECLLELKHEIVGIGPKEKPSNSNSSSFLNYYTIDLTQECSSKLEKVFFDENPRNVIVNSGIDSKPGTGQSSLTKYSIDSWREIIEVNLFGLVRVLNAALDSKRPPQNIVVIGSMYSEKSPNPHMYSHHGEIGLTKHPAYSTSKFGALSIVKQYASHYAAKGTLINMLSPGAVQSGQDPNFIEKIEKRIPLERLVSAEELRTILGFLLEKNTYAVGQNFVLDGGMNLW